MAILEYFCHFLHKKRILLYSLRAPLLRGASSEYSQHKGGYYDDHSLIFFFNLSIQIQSTLVISNSKGLTETLRDIRISTYQS